MQAVVLRGTSLTVEEWPRPSPGSGEVLVRVLAAGICGSDVHAASHLESMIEETGPTSWYAKADLTKGLVMGHEFVAEVVEVGPDVSEWAPGDRVVRAPPRETTRPVPPRMASAYSSELNGAFADHMVLWEPTLLTVAENIAVEVAATTEPCAVARHASHEADVDPHERVLILGAGPIGLMTLLWLKHDGVEFVAVSDPVAKRRELASGLGADLVLDPSASDFSSTLETGFGTSTGAPHSQTGQSAPDVVFDCVGIPGIIRQAMDAVKPLGRVIVVGVCMDEDRFMPVIGINKQLTIKFVMAYTRAEFEETLAAFSSGAIDTVPLVTRTVDLGDLPAQFARMANGDQHDCKVIVRDTLGTNDV